jgi:23S rRNA (cytosine1962-C5)-methyltransferase
MLKIHLKKGREKPIMNGHPWVFSGAIQNVEGDGTAGEPCKVMGGGGAVIGHGYYNMKSAITVRMLTKGDTPFTVQTLCTRLDRAVAERAPILAGAETDSCRLVNAEGDFLPGLVVDRYGPGLSVQFLTAGMERMRGEVIRALTARCSPAFIFERSDTEAREREGLPAESGPLAGTLPEKLIIMENGIKYAVDFAEGQKTGFYFDQRCNRALTRSYAGGRHCLDCFSYSGAFSLNIISGGAASVTAVDISKNAAPWCRGNLALNGVAMSRVENICADAFDFLRTLDRRYELIVLDPPKFARHPMEVPKAARGYKDINLAAMKNIATGGILFTFSCSNAVDSRLFRQVVFAAAIDAGRQVQLLHILSAGPDHPVNITHPEGEYLKGLALRVY